MANLRKKSCFGEIGKIPPTILAISLSQTRPTTCQISFPVRLNVSINLEITTSRPIKTTTKIYLYSNAKLNNQINDDLNRLLEIQVLKGVKYQELF